MLVLNRQGQEVCMAHTKKLEDMILKHLEFYKSKHSNFNYTSKDVSDIVDFIKVASKSLKKVTAKR